MGVSDILASWKGQVLAIEVKSLKGYPTIEQKTFIEDIRKTGGLAIIARSIDDVSAYLKQEGVL